MFDDSPFLGSEEDTSAGTDMGVAAVAASNNGAFNTEAASALANELLEGGDHPAIETMGDTDPNSGNDGMGVANEAEADQYAAEAVAAGSGLSAIRSRSQGAVEGYSIPVLANPNSNNSNTGVPGAGPSAAAMASFADKQTKEVALSRAKEEKANRRSKLKGISRARIEAGQETGTGTSTGANGTNANSSGTGTNKSAAEQILEGAVPNALTEEEKALRREAAKERKNKTALMLAALQEKKQGEAEKKRKKEAALKKRQAILQGRIVAEAAERKTMCLEDQLKYQQLAAMGSGPSRRRASFGNEEELQKKPNNSGGSGGGSSSSKTASASSSSARDTSSKSSISNRDSDALVSRLKNKVLRNEEGVALSQTQSVPPRDYADWRRKNMVPADAKVFAMTGWYPCVKEALLERGWYINSDVDSPYWDLKWTLRSLEVNQDQLQPWQLTNHFMKNVAITTKVGLIRSLQSLPWLADVHANAVIPRGYDLSTNTDMQAFLDDYRSQHAEIILKKLYRRVTGVSFPEKGPVIVPAEQEEGDEEEDDEDEEEDDDSENDSSEEKVEKKNKGKEITMPEPEEDANEYKRPSTPKMLTKPLARGGSASKKKRKNKKSPRGEEDPTVNEKGEVLVNNYVFETCCTLLEHFLRPTDENFLDDPAWEEQLYGKGGAASNERVCDQALENTHSSIIDPLEWEVVNFDVHSVHTLPEETPIAVDGFLKQGEDDGINVKSSKEFTSKNNVGNYGGNSNTMGTAATSKMDAQALQRQRKKREKQMAAQREDANKALQELRPITDADLKRIHRLLNDLHLNDREQAGLNGSGDISKNIWIVKPGAKSRGRGIATFAELPKLLKYVDAGCGSAKAAQWVVQKYMENPLCIAKHKFDLRQWVLVTNWNPLTVYFYDECYARFSVEEYTTSDEGLDNAYVHLVNNSISKTNERFHVPIPTEYGDDISGFMWSHEQISEWIKNNPESGGRDLMKDKIQPRMKEIAKWSLMCAAECIEHRANSWELYGFDFMVDDNFNTWLIEINSSPACDYSTKTTERYVQKALVELLSVTLDMRDWDKAQTSKKARKAAGEKPDTGGWELIHKGPSIDMPTAAFGVDMSLRGEIIKGPKKATAPRTTLPFANSASRGEANSLRASGENNIQMPKPPAASVSRRQGNLNGRGGHGVKAPAPVTDFDDFDDDVSLDASLSLEDLNVSESQAHSHTGLSGRKLGGHGGNGNTHAPSAPPKVNSPTRGRVGAVAVGVRGARGGPRGASGIIVSGSPMRQVCVL